MKTINGPLQKIIFSIEKENILRFGLGAASDSLHHYSQRVQYLYSLATLENMFSNKQLLLGDASNRSASGVRV